MTSRRASGWNGCCLALAGLLGFGALGCKKDLGPDPYYRPAENVVEVIAVLRRHVNDDTYRFSPARDFTGRNIYRAALIRLENLEHAHASDLRAGHMDDVIDFAKGRALERVRGYDLAAKSYRRAALVDGPLREDALRSAAICDALAEAVELEPGFEVATGQEAQPENADLEGDPPKGALAPQPGGGDSAPDRNGMQDPASETRPSLATQERALELFDQRRALLEAISPDVAESHYAFVVREELERALADRADYLVQTRHLTPDGDVMAVAALQQVILENRESKNANRNLLELADFYAGMAEDYVEANPPESLSFDPPSFEELVNNAARLYEAVANQDGATERIEASRQLEAFLAFTLRVDHDRFSR